MFMKGGGCLAKSEATISPLRWTERLHKLGTAGTVGRSTSRGTDQSGAVEAGAGEGSAERCRDGVCETGAGTCTATSSKTARSWSGHNDMK